MKKTILLLAVTLLAGTSLAQEDKDTWNLGDLYPSVDAWNKAKVTLEADLAKIDHCKGQLGASAAKLLECSDMLSDIFKTFSRISSYAGMASDADTRDAANQQRRTEVQILGSKLSEKISFIDPEILEVGADKLNGFLAELAALEPYKHDIQDTLRQAEHVLGADAEAMMAATSMMRSTPSNTYRTLANADMPWPTITLSSGEEVRLDQSAYSKYRSTDVRSDRQAVFENFWGKWKEFERTTGTTLAGQVNVHVFNHRQRGYENSLAASLDNNNIPETVYHTLIAETNNNLATLHRYLKLRARMLGVDELRYFDGYPSLVESNKKFPISAGKQLTLEAVAPLGNAYTEVMSSGFENRWMDVYPRQEIGRAHV